MTAHLKRITVDRDKEIKELKMNTHFNDSDSKLGIVCKLPNFVVESAHGAFTGTGLFQGRPKQVEFAGSILAPLNPCLIPRYIILESNRTYKDVNTFLQHNFGELLRYVWQRQEESRC